MALVKCVECGREVSDSAPACPGCGKPAGAQAPATAAAKSTGGAAKGFFGLLIALGLAWYFFGGGLEQQAARDMNKIEQTVAQDLVQQYDIAKRSGGAMDRCVAAGVAAAGFQQAQDEPGYAKWKKIEADDCAEAGVPR